MNHDMPHHETRVNQAVVLTMNLEADRRAMHACTLLWRPHSDFNLTFRISTYIRNSTGFLNQIFGKTLARRAQNSGPLCSFFFCAQEVHTKPTILTRSNSSMKVMCHGYHARNHWHVALLLTEFAGTFIDPFWKTTLAQSAREPESTSRATQQSAVIKIEGVGS